MTGEASAKYNVLFITADQLRFDALGCSGNPAARTPAIDRLAAEGVRFESMFVQSPVCQPSRAAFMTGRYPRNHGVKWNGSALNENELTMLEHFKRNGYVTAMIGKHRIRQQRFAQAIDVQAADNIRRVWRKEREDGDYTVEPGQENEFEAYVRSRGYEYRTGYALPNFRSNLGTVPSSLPEDCHLDAYVGMKGAEFLRSRDGGEPFFLWLGFYGPHHPYVPSGPFARMFDSIPLPPMRRSPFDLAKKPPEYRMFCESDRHKFRGFLSASEEKLNKMRAAYYGMVSQLDRQLGLVLEALEETGQADNTMIVFLSDHGDFLGDHGIPGKAPFLLDCMLHVPCILRVPNGKRGGAVRGLAESVDIFPTLCALAGIDIPRHVQGFDLSAAVLDPQRRLVACREEIYAEAVDKKCIRTQRWKYVHYPCKPYGELYRLDEDPHELDNVHDEYPEVVREMRERYYAVLDRTEETVHPSYKQITGTDPRSGERMTLFMTV